MPNCELCGEPMPAGEETFKYHGFSGPCPKKPSAIRPPAPLTVADAIRHAAKSGFEVLFRIPVGLRGIQVSTGDPPGKFTVGTWHQSISDEELDERGDQAIIHAVEIAMHQLEAARAAKGESPA